MTRTLLAMLLLGCSAATTSPAVDGGTDASLASDSAVTPVADASADAGELVCPASVMPVEPSSWLLVTNTCDDAHGMVTGLSTRIDGCILTAGLAIACDAGHGMPVAHAGWWVDHTPGTFKFEWCTGRVLARCTARYDAGILTVTCLDCAMTFERDAH